MAKPFEQEGASLEGLLGLGNHSMRKHHYAELVGRLEELETERNRYRQLNDELERRVLERTEQLRLARDAAEAANRSKDKYLAAASHDLLQPLNAARLLISALRERDLPPTEAHLVERSHLALEGAEQLLSDLLDIARLDQDAVTPTLAPLALQQWLPSLAAEFEPVAAAKGLKIRCRVGRDAVVETDAHLLARIVRNLISNACRYTSSGGVLVAARKAQRGMLLQVWDSGCGIPADQQQVIFQAFRQLDTGRAADRQGVGLGLAIVERMATILRHPVSVRSRVGRGSVFSVALPLSTEPLPPTTTATGLPVAFDPLPGTSVLVVDNEPAILESMAALLAQWGCQVRTALDERSALEGPPAQVVVIDYHLDHGKLGTELLVVLRKAWGEDLRALFITADRSDACREAMRKLGAPQLNKPARPGKLRATLAALLAGGDGLRLGTAR